MKFLATLYVYMVAKELNYPVIAVVCLVMCAVYAGITVISVYRNKAHQ